MGYLVSKIISAKRWIRPVERLMVPQCEKTFLRGYARLKFFELNREHLGLSQKY